MLPEGNGMHAQLLRVCQRLAAEGYTVIAPDVFWRFGGSDPARMPSQFMAMRSEDALADIAECVAELHRLGVTKVGVTGFCMGGRITYETATKMLDGAPVDVQAAAPFYGATIGKLLAEPHCPILCFFGGADDYIPPDEIAAVQAFHDGQVVVYPQAGHGFMRDGSDSYDEAAATDAWRKLLAFFAEHLR